ncbi:hypothetical protein [Bradyrhizobium japonicum]|uniref:hypothetical protein n=1 Tax=Bradyrhizobium japonicum TaxID=375 RepID=UPI0004802C28|nr:hypothetical protein [Bradyrhizobium japonicum]
MASNKELQTGLKAMSEDYHLLNGGRKRLSRLVASHLWWFDAAERRGMSWRDMIGVLTAAGISGRGGQPLSVGTLSSTVWRARAEKEPEADNQGRQRGLEPEASRPRAKAPAKAPRHPAAPLRQERRVASPQDVIEVSNVRRTSTSSPRLERANKDVLAFMDRARKVRRRSEV